MWETNVMGTLRVTRALLPKLIDSGDGLIVTITSIAAMEVYDGGAGYTAAKHAQGALHRTLRGELLGKPVRLTEIAPGAVETEFSLVRFDGDQQRADAVYTGMTPLVAADIAEVIGFVAVTAFARQPGPDHHPAARPGAASRRFNRPGTSGGSRRRRRARQAGRVRRCDRRGDRDLSRRRMRLRGR